MDQFLNEFLKIEYKLFQRNCKKRVVLLKKILFTVRRAEIILDAHLNTELIVPEYSAFIDDRLHLEYIYNKLWFEDVFLSSMKRCFKYENKTKGSRLLQRLYKLDWVLFCVIIKCILRRLDRSSTITGGDGDGDDDDGSSAAVINNDLQLYLASTKNVHLMSEDSTFRSFLNSFEFLLQYRSLQFLYPRSYIYIQDNYLAPQFKEEIL